MKPFLISGDGSRSRDWFCTYEQRREMIMNCRRNMHRRERKFRKDLLKKIDGLFKPILKSIEREFRSELRHRS